VRLRQIGLPKPHEIHHAHAVASAHNKRIMKLEVSNTRRLGAPGIGHKRLLVNAIASGIILVMQ